MDIDLYGIVEIEIHEAGRDIFLHRKFGTRRSYQDSARLPLDGSAMRIPVSNRVFPTNVFMGLQMPVGGSRTMSARWINAGSSLKIQESFDALGSQGKVKMGAWTKEGRGEILYAWVLGMNDLWMAPSMLEFFYSQATPNDYFIGGTTPGYIYPKMVPNAVRSELLKMAGQKPTYKERFFER